MTLRRSEAVIQAIVDGLTAKLPTVKVERNRDVVTDPGAGLVIVRDGDAGEPEVILSPRAYSYHHAVGIEVIAPDHTSLDTILQSIDDWVDANRGLGGLLDWLEPATPQTDGAEKSGTDNWPFALFDLVASYTTPSPLK